MAGAPKGNKNALKHGLYAKQAISGQELEGQARELEFAIRHLEHVIDDICIRLEEAEGDRYTRLTTALSMATTALFNGHRTKAYLSGGMTPIEDALKELMAMDFAED